MNFLEYQKLASRTINKKLNRKQKEYHSLHGMVSEIGELHGIYQKIYQGHVDTDEHKKKELGDLLWFIAEYCTANKWSMDDIACLNIDKLMLRYPEGFDINKSVHRKEDDV